jgi:hypothetical protein
MSYLPEQSLRDFANPANVLNRVIVRLKETVIHKVVTLDAGQQAPIVVR